MPPPVMKTHASSKKACREKTPLPLQAGRWRKFFFFTCFCFSAKELSAECHTYSLFQNKFRFAMSFLCFRHFEHRRKDCFQFFDMGDDADHAACLLQADQSID